MSNRKNIVIYGFNLCGMVHTTGVRPPILRPHRSLVLSLYFIPLTSELHLKLFKSNQMKFKSHNSNNIKLTPRYMLGILEMLMT